MSQVLTFARDATTADLSRRAADDPAQRALVRAGVDGVIVASALVDALGPDGRNVAALGRLVTHLRGAANRR